MPKDLEEAVYVIVIQGHLAHGRMRQFPTMQLTLLSNGCSQLRGRVIDRAALCGLLNQICDLGVRLVRVERLEQTQA